MNQNHYYVSGFSRGFQRHETPNRVPAPEIEPINTKQYDAKQSKFDNVPRLAMRVQRLVYYKT